jgi:hypothetical protein
MPQRAATPYHGTTALSFDMQTMSIRALWHSPHCQRRRVSGASPRPFGQAPAAMPRSAAHALAGAAPEVSVASECEALVHRVIAMPRPGQTN